MSADTGTVYLPQIARLGSDIALIGSDYNASVPNFLGTEPEFKTYRRRTKRTSPTSFYNVSLEYDEILNSHLPLDLRLIGSNHSPNFKRKSSFIRSNNNSTAKYISIFCYWKITKWYHGIWKWTSNSQN